MNSLSRLVRLVSFAGSLLLACSGGMTIAGESQVADLELTFQDA